MDLKKNIIIGITLIWIGFALAFIIPVDFIVIVGGFLFSGMAILVISIVLRVNNIR